LPHKDPVHSRCFLASVVRRLVRSCWFGGRTAGGEGRSSPLQVHDRLNRCFLPFWLPSI
jgi:hypothetical protein